MYICFISARCSPLSDHVNGMISVTTDGTSTVAEFTCEQGFTVSGSAYVECQPNGTWSFDIQPSCGKYSFHHLCDISVLSKSSIQLWLSIFYHILQVHL